jgi:hypothetical protein
MFNGGDKVMIVKDNISCVIGKIGTVSYFQSDSFNKIKVSFDDNWQGFFKPEQLIKVKVSKE